MKIFLTVLFLSILIVISIPAMAQEVENMVLGVSPANARTCISAGNFSTVEFLISTNIDMPKNVSIGYLKGPRWADSKRYVTFMNTYKLLVAVSVPPNVTEDTYDIKMLVCTPVVSPLNESLSTETCLSPWISVNVSDGCLVKEEKKEAEPAPDTLNVLRYAILLAIIVASAVFILRQVSKIKNKKRQ